jgi:hypothetical protein
LAQIRNAVIRAVIIFVVYLIPGPFPVDKPPSEPMRFITAKAVAVVDGLFCPG